VSVIRRAVIICAAAALSLCASLAFASPGWGWAIKRTTVASGLDNPRDLAFGANVRSANAAVIRVGAKEAAKPPPRRVLPSTRRVRRKRVNGGKPNERSESSSRATSANARAANEKNEAKKRN